MTLTALMKLIFVMHLHLQPPKRINKWQETLHFQTNLPRLSILIPVRGSQLQIRISLLYPRPGVLLWHPAKMLPQLQDPQAMLASSQGQRARMLALFNAITALKRLISLPWRPVWCVELPCVRSTCALTWSPLSSGITLWFLQWRTFLPGGVRITRRCTASTVGSAECVCARCAPS